MRSLVNVSLYSLRLFFFSCAGLFCAEYDQHRFLFGIFRDRIRAIFFILCRYFQHSLCCCCCEYTIFKVICANSFIHSTESTIYVITLLKKKIMNTMLTIIKFMYRYGICCIFIVCSSYHFVVDSEKASRCEECFVREECDRRKTKTTMMMNAFAYFCV